MSRAYAIGDIHGHLGLLRSAQARVAADRQRTGDMDAPLIHLGDLVDRGPDSAGVIAHLMAGPSDGTRWITVKGNHDHMFALYLRDPPQTDPGLRGDLDWTDHRLGGGTTLSSYGIDIVLPPDDLHAQALARVPPAHRTFLDALPLMHRHGEAVFVHAGIRPGVPLAAQDPQDLIWIRRPFHEDRRDHGALIVHGHTPVDAARHYGNRLNLDTGAAYGGPLSVAVIEGRDAWLLTDDGRQPLPPRP